MNRALALGVVLWGAVSAHAATSLSVVGQWYQSSGFASACSDSGSGAASCSASAPGVNFVAPDGGTYNTGGSSLSGSETLGRAFSSPINDISGGVEVYGSASLSARGMVDGPSPSQPIVTLSGTLDLPSDWGNIDVHSYADEESDQWITPPQVRPTPELVLTTSDGQSILTGTEAGSDYLSGTFLHTSGTPLSLSWTKRVTCCEAIDSGDDYQFDVIFTGTAASDPSLVATPEPSSYLLFGSALLALVPLRRKIVQSIYSISDRT